MKRLRADLVDLLEYILTRQANGLPPTLREIGTALRMPFGSVRLRLAELRSLGLVAWTPGRKRTLIPTCRFIPAEELP